MKWKLLAVAVASIVIGGTSNGGFDSADAAAAGFKWKGHNGKTIAGQDLQNLCDAIATLATVDAGGAACATTLKNTCNSFCKEGGSAKSRFAARALVDKDATSAEGDKVNIHSKYLREKKTRPGLQGLPIGYIHFVGLLAHEMVHTKQVGVAGAGVRPIEKAAYCKEKQVLEALFGSVKRAKKDRRYKAVCAWKKELCTGKKQRGCAIYASGDTPGDIVLYFDGSRKVGYQNTLLIYDIATDTDTELPGFIDGQFQLTCKNLDVVEMTGTPYIAVSLHRETKNGIEGLIEYLKVTGDPAAPIVSVQVVSLGSIVATGLAWDEGTNSLYTWNPESKEVHSVATATGGTVPSLVSTTPYASAASYPQISDAWEVEVDEDGAVYLTEQELGVFNASIADSPWWKLTDTNADGVADTIQQFHERDGMHFVATTIDPLLVAGETEVEVMSSINTCFEVWSALPDGTPVELLGGGFNDSSDYYEILELSRPLVAGEFILVHDIIDDTWSGMESRIVQP